MPLSVTEDETAPPGYAVIDLGRRVATPALRLSFRRTQNEPRHLGREGWQPEAAFLDVGPVDNAGPSSRVQVGPEIVSWIDELELVETLPEDGPAFGSLAWPSLPRPALVDADILVARERKTPVPASPPPYQPPPRPAEVVAPPPPPTAPEPPPVPPAPPSPPAAAPGRTSSEDAVSPAVPGRNRALLGGFLALVAVAVLTAGYLGRESWWPPMPQPAPPRPAPVPDPEIARRAVAAEIDDLIKRRAPPDDLLRAGDKALRLGAGNAAFKAFDEIPKTDDVAWRMARFYDPAETEPAYRQSDVRPNPANAASYYALFKGRSQRHTDALTRLCAANQSLQASNPEFKKNCLR